MLMANKKWLPNQASKQLTPNETNKTAETTSKTQTVAYLKHKVKKQQQKNTPPNHINPIDYCLQQMSGRLHWLHLLQP